MNSRVQFSSITNIGWVKIEFDAIGDPRTLVDGTVAKVKVLEIHPAEGRILAQPDQGGPSRVANASGQVGQILNAYAPTHCQLRRGAEIHLVDTNAYVKLEDIINWYWEDEEGDKAS